MQIRIAVCDDERAVSSLVEELVMKIAEELSIQCDVDVYDSGEVLCHELDKEEYDLIFLDIELPKMNGIEIGKYIREVQRNEIVQIAYISAKEQYAMELFDYRPINFLVKPLDINKVKKVIAKLIVIVKDKIQLFTYKKGYDFVKVPISEILYFERERRKITVTTSKMTDTFYENLEEIYAKVKSNKFLFVHKSFIVNYRYIRRMKYDEVEMIDGRHIPISQSHRKLIRQMYMKMVEEL